MSLVIDEKLLTAPLFELLDEVFETHHGIFLYPGTSLFDTLATINATEASLAVGGKCATLAAQVAHVTFYLEVLERYILSQDAGEVDWGEIWRCVQEVTPEEWEAFNRNLRQTYQRVLIMLHGQESWQSETTIGGALAILAHTAYHLGEIRQALCTLK
jgi:hypothetical protein